MGKKKSVKRSGCGICYHLAWSEKELAKVTGQGRLIAKTLKRMRKATAKQLRSRIGKSFKTKNAATNVIGVYLSRFRRKGLLAAKLPARPDSIAGRPVWGGY